MRSDKSKRHAKLVSLVVELTAKSPFDFEGFAWAALSQSEWASQLGISDKTLRDLAKLPPIVSTKTQIQDKVVVLYRIGAGPHSSYRHIANILSKIFRDKYGLKRIPPHDYGCLVGLAEVWPDGVQAQIFKSVLRNFVEFRGAVKLAEPDSPHFDRYYDFVPIRLIRKFPDLALEVYENEIQANCKVPHPAIVALNPKKWISPMTGNLLAVDSKKQIAGGLVKKAPDAPSPLSGV